MTNTLKATLLTILSSTAIQGCSTLDYDPLNEFKNNGIGKAAYELGCASDQLDVVALGGASYGVIGCGKKAIYIGPTENGFTRSSDIEIIK